MSMELVLEIPPRELFDEAESRIYETPKTILTLKHSLLSVADWEAKWHRPYLIQSILTEEANRKTPEQDRDYVRCMTMNRNPVDPLIYRVLSREEMQKIHEYVNDPMSATTIANQNGKPNREIITNEIIYGWMATLQIPFRPCETWHLNHLMKLIESLAAKQEQPKRMPQAEAMKRRASINSARRAAHARRPHR